MAYVPTGFMRVADVPRAARPSALGRASAMPRSWNRWLRWLALAVLVWAGVAQAQISSGVPELNAALGEQVVMVPQRGKLFNAELETTIYRPVGDGPFPVALISHGKAAGDTRFQARYRPAGAARFLLARGYVVVVPMRMGFSKSGGSYVGGGCNVASNGRVQAQDIQSVLDWLAGQPWADVHQVLLIGQSHGGWTTLAAGAMELAGVKGLVNFAGGLRQPDCPGWEGTLVRAGASYAKATHVPGLWFYGENDSYFAPSVWKPLAAAYADAGASVEVVNVGRFGSDSHTLFGATAGEPLWQPKLARFMASVGLPVAVRYPEYLRAGRMAMLPATGFAALDDIEKVPYLKPGGREAYRVFLGKQMPRAFAIAPNGAWAWAEMGDDPLARALANCQRHATAPCRLYVVDDQVVWKEP